MGSTFVDFKGHGFEANDATLEVWLALLVDEIDRMPDAPQWLRDLREEWETQATAKFGFGVMPGLDNAVTDESRRVAILALASRALQRLESLGDPIPQATLNAIRDWGEGYRYTGDVPAVNFVRPAQYFIKVLEGCLAPEENDALFPSTVSPEVHPARGAVG
jgi:hypothetical protein